MSANLDALLAAIAGLGLRAEAQSTEGALASLAEMCRQAHTLELGQILSETTSGDAREVVATEIRRRLAQW